MTLTTTQIETIRHLATVEEQSQRSIAKTLEISRNTVKKYLDTGDFNPTPPNPEQPGAKVLTEQHKKTIITWLEQDRTKPCKQRHTARRIYHRLVDEYGYTHSYSPVQRFVKAYKEQHPNPPKHSFSPRTPQPGTIEVDFGQAEVTIAGTPTTVHMLIVTFPYSNMRFGQLFYGETAECVTTGLQKIIHHIGGVPPQMVFDNATAIGRRIGQNVSTSKLFGQFALHYHTQARFCNPNSGHEKGNVENAVGFLRRNLLVPIPQAATLAELNEQFFTRSQAYGNQLHYRHKIPINELFQHDLAALTELPGTGFDPVTYRKCTADKTGVITIENNRYLVGPHYASRRLIAKLSHDSVTVLDQQHAPLVQLPRRFGQHPELIYTPTSFLPYLTTKPSAWAQSPLRADIPDPLAQWLDKAAPAQRAKVFGALDAAAEATTFGCAIQAAGTLINTTGGSGADNYSLDMLARRIHQGETIPESTANLSVYDTLTARKPTFSSCQGDAA